MKHIVWLIQQIGYAISSIAMVPVLLLCTVITALGCILVRLFPERD